MKMAKIYANRIRAGKWRLEDVPERWRAETERILSEQ